MRKITILIMALFMTTPAWALLTEDFKTKPFGKTGIWAESGDVKWTGKKLNYVNLGKGSGNNDNRMWVSFTAPTTANYSISFDYRFFGSDKNAKLDDTFSVQVGEDKDSLNKLFEATSSTDLTGSKNKPGAWHNITTPEQAATLEAGKTYKLLFELNEVKGKKAPVTSLQLDNISINEIASSPIVIDPASRVITLPEVGGQYELPPIDNRPPCGIPPGDDGHYEGPPSVPAPGALMLSSIGAGFIGWLRKRRIL